jgi:hypothetical protein
MPTPVRTGNDQVDRDLRLYTPLNRRLGIAELDHLSLRVSDSIVSPPVRTPEQMAQDATNALRAGVEELICAYNPDTKERQWYNTSTGQWGGLC